MSAPRRQSDYSNGGFRPKLASHHHAPFLSNTAAPPGFGQNIEPSNGPQDLEMSDLLENIDNFELSSQQGHSTAASGPRHSQPREDDLDLIASAYNNSIHFQHSSIQDLAGNNVDKYQAPSTQPPWNSFVAAQHQPIAGTSLSRQADLSSMYLTPIRQTNYNPSDSTYYSQSQQEDAGSVRSARSNSFGQRLDHTQAVPRYMPPQPITRTHSQGPTGPASMASGRRSTQQAPRSEASSVVASIVCEEEGCNLTFKTASDHKKHLARHKLDHVCDEGDCARNGKGFATVNDLVRHRKTVHKLLPEGERMYRCFARGCNRPEKDWPRKDNFRSHLRKAHKHEDEDELVQKSEAWWDGLHGADMQADATTPSQQPWHEGLNTEPRGYAQTMTPLHSSSVSEPGYPQSASVFQSQQPQNRYAPLGADTNPDTGLMTRSNVSTYQQNNFQQIQAFNAWYRTGNNTFLRPHTPVTSSANVQTPSTPSPRNRAQQSSQPASVAGSMSRHRTGGSLQQNWSSVDRPLHSSRAQNMPQNYLQSPLQLGGVRARTLPDYSTEQDRQADMVGFTAFRSDQTPTLASFPAQNDFSQIGTNLEHPDIDASPANSNVPQITLQHANMENSSDFTGADFDVEELNRIVQVFAQRADNDPRRIRAQNALKSALQSLGSNQGTESSLAAPNDLSSEEHIEEFINDSGKKAFKCKYSGCASSKPEWALKSEIKKHIKRHTKPFGCTFDNCYRRFGSKSDWMRHEIKRHSQQECWRCDLKKPSAPQIQHCQKTFDKKEGFTAHLKEVHAKVETREVTSLLTTQHINAGFQPRYWCGFCGGIKLLAKKGKEGIHERYDHIARHITDEHDERCIDDWVPPDGNLSKANRHSQRLKGGPGKHDDDDEDEEDADADEEGDASPDVPTSEESSLLSSLNETHSRPANAPSMSRSPHSRPQQASLSARGSTNSPQSGGKRTASRAGLEYSQQPKRGPATHWYCHECSWMNLWATSPACNMCDHQRCDGCRSDR